MFQLSVQDIHPGEKAGDKEEAIRQVAAAREKAFHGLLAGWLMIEETEKEKGVSLC